jgi:hypothetical protein
VIRDTVRLPSVDTDAGGIFIRTTCAIWATALDGRWIRQHAHGLLPRSQRIEQLLFEI